MEGTLAVPRETRARSRRAQSGAARSCAELRQRTGGLSTRAARPTAALVAQGGRSDITLAEEQIPAVPAPILNPGRRRLIVAGAWKDSSRTHLFEGRAARLRRACSQRSLRGKLLSAWVITCLKSCQLKKDATQMGLSTPHAANPLHGSGIDWRRCRVPSAKNVADAASRWADAGLLSRRSACTPSLQNKRAGETWQGSIRWQKFVQQLAGPLTKSCSQTGPDFSSSFSREKRI